MSPFTCEDDFTHCIQNENHNSRKASLGIGAIRKSYKWKNGQWHHLTRSYFHLVLSLSIGIKFIDSLNEANVYPPYVMGYGKCSQNYVMGSKFNRWRVWYVQLFSFYTNIIPCSILDARRTWHEHMGES